MIVRGSVLQGRITAGLEGATVPTTSGGGTAPTVGAEGEVSITHEPRLGYGGYITRDSIRAVFVGAEFHPAEPDQLSRTSRSPGMGSAAPRGRSCRRRRCCRGLGCGSAWAVLTSS